MTIRYELSRMPDQAGLCRVRICYQDRGKRKYEPTLLKVRPQHWDQSGQRVLPQAPHAALINEQLRMKMAELTLKHFQEPAGLLMAKAPTLVGFAAECLSRWEHTKSAGTLRAYQSMLRKLKEYDDRVPINKVDSLWLTRYEHHSRLQGCQDAGALKRVAFVSTVLNEALRLGVIRHTPFATYKKPAKRNPQKAWLSVDELRRLANLQTDSQVLNNVRVWFFFACLTGLRYSDVQQLDFDRHVQDGRLVLYTMKTGQLVTRQITPMLQQLMDMWPSVPVYSNQKCNQYLKALAVACKINKTLTFHSARHTFAMQIAQAGVSQEVASKLLGHSDLKVTAIYYKLVDERVDRELLAWDNLLKL